MVDDMADRVSARLRAALLAVRQLRSRAAASISRQEVMDHIHDGGDLTPRFALMAVLSCGIAILGLLQNSVAVIIGAMLVSPLMGPIVALGFSLTTRDFRQMERSVLALGVGLAVALVMSVLIVSVSPLQAETPEILARTQPNLFDLLVAVFSGLAGGYAVIKRKGEAIVGVAIATALMPPLAVVGYGLATAKMHIAAGSFFLFMTNLLAIALSVAVLARWYRFSASDSPTNLLWQTVLTIAVFAALSIPLGLALVNIARKTVASVTVRAEVEREFDRRHSSIERLSISGGEAESPLDVAATVLTPEFRRDADRRIGERIKDKLGVDAQVSVDQIVVSSEDLRERVSKQAAETALLRASLEPMAEAFRQRQEAVAAVQSAVFFETRTMDVEPSGKRIRVEPTAEAEIGLAALRQLEQSLRLRFPDWDVTVMPAVSALPSLYFESGRDALLAGQDTVFQDILWALEAWQVEQVTVVGFASSPGSAAANRSLAQRRAEWVAESMRAAGFDALALAESRVPNQRDLERRFGLTYLQRVDIRVGQGPDPVRIPVPAA